SDGIPRHGRRPGHRQAPRRTPRRAYLGGKPARRRRHVFLHLTGQAGRRTQATMTPSTLLIVEDEAVVAGDLEARLKRNGYTVCGVAVSGDEALALARQHRPDLALMDIRLQGAMDGIQTAEVLRRELDVPVIYLRANSDASMLQRAN